MSFILDICWISRKKVVVSEVKDVSNIISCLKPACESQKSRPMLTAEHDDAAEKRERWRSRIIQLQQRVGSTASPGERYQTDPLLNSCTYVNEYFYLILRFKHFQFYKMNTIWFGHNFKNLTILSLCRHFIHRIILCGTYPKTKRPMITTA